MSVTIRFATEDDAPALASIYSAYVLNTCISCEYEAPTAADFQQRMQEIMPQYPYLVAVVDGEVAGYAYAHRYQARPAYQWNAEVSIYVRAGMSGQGIGTALYTTLFALLQRQHVQNLYAIISTPNPASERLHEHFGFRKTGTLHRTAFKFGRWIDVNTFEKQLGGHEIPPLPFIALDKLGQALNKLLD